MGRQVRLIRLVLMLPVTPVHLLQDLDEPQLDQIHNDQSHKEDPANKENKY